jgi:hypothetical protein
MRDGGVGAEAQVNLAGDQVLRRRGRGTNWNPRRIGRQLIVAQRARAHGVTIGFWEYFKVGAPLTVLTILFGAWWL